MRQRFEFAFHELKAGSDPNDDATIALLGSQGWELRSIAVRAGGELVVALQRPMDEEHPLPREAELAEALESPLRAPGFEDFDTV